ncbi:MULTISPECIES: MFS transporter [Streptomyces]|uniref:MFS transporter n=1 Tax=Streptomyces virginiae TaxID=1961 RepID=A0ABZ1TL90_STRVG|nr:MFS transporter [Streptomyces virginiae]
MNLGRTKGGPPAPPRAGSALAAGGTTWVVNAYGLAFGARLPAGGREGDLLGRRRVLLAGLAVFAGASPGLLIAARAVQGAGAAVIAPAALALALDLFPPAPGRGRALGLWGANFGGGGAGGVPLGGVLTQAWGRPWVLAVALGTAPVLIAVSTPVPRATDRASGRFGLLGTATVTLTLALMSSVWASTAARATGWTDAGVLTALMGAVVLLVLFALVGRRRPHRPDPAQAVHDRIDRARLNVRELVPGKRIVWGGTVEGIVGIHVWAVERSDARVVVHTEESWSGEPVEAAVEEELAAALMGSPQGRLDCLKARAEQPI